MGVYWMTEAVPIPVTALIPVFAFPMMGIASTETICKVYMKGTTMMFLGGLAMAAAVEHCNLHKRIALFIILNIGQSPSRLLAGFMITSMFLSMWISNTAATAMMVPIVDAILQELYGEIPKSDDSSSSTTQKNQIELRQSKDSEHINVESETDVEKSKNDIVESRALSTMYLLGTAYAASLGGTGFPTGTGPNLVLWELMEKRFESAETGLNFISWMLFNIPSMLLASLFTWMYLQFWFIGIGKWRKIGESTSERKLKIRQLVERHYNALGKVTFHESAVFTLFLTMVFLWVFMKPEFVPGWADRFEAIFSKDVSIGNATPAIFVVLMLFIIPAKLNFWPFVSIEESLSSKSSETCLTWKVLQHKLPWGLVILMGGGFALAEGASQSGFSQWMGDQLQLLSFLPPSVLVLFVAFIVSFMTEILSNITAASVLIPVVLELASVTEMNPLFLAIPACLSCSYAFMIPVSNPPNAIAYNASSMSTMDMVKAGVVIKIGSVLIMLVMLNTLGAVIFDVHNIPHWVNTTISTLQ